MIRQLLIVAVVGLIAVGLTACESTQDQSARKKSEGVKLLDVEGLSVDKVNDQVEVLDSAVLTDENGSAVAVEVHNKSGRGMVNVPISINVLSKKGKSLFRNDDAGIETTLVAVPLLAPDQTEYWVNDQVFATARPSSVKVKVGESSETYPVDPPQMEWTDPKLEGDPVSGLAARGWLTNKSDRELKRIVLYAVGIKNGKVVAAGTGLVKKLKTGDKRSRYEIFFIGDPSGSEIQVNAFPTVF